MKLNKKSQEVGRNTILMIIILLLVVIVMAVIYSQAKDVIIVYMDRIFG
jgi:dipeptide/tripeptide permease